MFVKVCGLKSQEEIDMAADLGFSAAGIILHPKSPRYVSPEHAIRMTENTRGRIKTVAVGITFDEVRDVYDYFDFIQIYSYKHTPKTIFAGTKLPDSDEFKYFLFDKSKGSGEFTGYPLWIKQIKDRLILSGGICNENVSAVVHDFNPFGIDVCSGVESSPGKKDFLKMKEFINEVRK